MSRRIDPNMCRTLVVPFCLTSTKVFYRYLSVEYLSVKLCLDLSVAIVILVFAT